MRYAPAMEELEEELSRVDLDKIIKNELSKNKASSLYEVTDDILILFNHGERGQSKLHVGFPFTLYTKNFFPDLNNLKVDIFIRGEPVRKLQREMIKEISSNYTEINSGFPDFIRGMIGSSDRCIYVDPYTFIGDSFIGLYFLDSFKETFGVKNELMFSTQSDHLSSTTHCKHYSPEEVGKETKNGDVILMPDLIDTHFEKSLQTISELKGKNVKMLIPGRGLLLDIQEEKIKSYHFNYDDILLRNKNIEDYMAECLSIFGVSGIAISEEKGFHNSSRFFFNPFTSQEKRYIPPELMFYAYKNLKEADKKAEFYLIAGYHKNRSHADWLNNFLTLMKEDGSMRRVSINYYANLSELLDHLEEKECSAIFTADTSIAHVANRYGYTNITMYNPEAWDADSIQSLSSLSPAGFCRYFYTQMPLINKGYHIADIKRTASIAAHAILFFQRNLREQKQIFEHNEPDWMKEMYDPLKMIYGIQTNEKAASLINSANKISPFIKIRELQHGN